MMKIILVLCLSLFTHLLYAVQFSSSEEQATLIELFTSQGCSSCPPADRWLANFKNHPDLWTKYIPVAWHVNYWDYIGWKDQFAQAAFVDRQRLYKANGNIRSVYTPGLLKNGKEWRSWFWIKKLDDRALKVGKLSASYKDDKVYIDYKPLNKIANRPLNFNIALLASNLSSKVTAGENHGKTLQHNFVVRQHKSVLSKENHLNVFFPFQKDNSQALAVWLSDPVSNEVIQATGTWLE